MKEITSSSNPKFKLWRTLLSAKGIKKEGLCLVSGEKILSDLMRSKEFEVVDWIVSAKNYEALEKLRIGSKTPVTRLSADLFNELDVSGTHFPLAVARCPVVKNWKPSPPRGLNLIVALSDPTNLGALIRTAEAFAASGVIMCKECSSPLLPRAIRASSGSVFRLPLFHGPSISDLFIETAYGLDLEGMDINQVSLPRDLYLILGEEGQGLPDRLKVNRVRIPMNPSVDSLNATAAGTVAIFRYRQIFPINNQPKS